MNNMSKQCRYVKSDNKRCRNKVLYGDLRWIHSKFKRINFFLVFAATIGLLVNFNNIKKNITLAQLKEDSELICDRYFDKGCYLNFKDVKLSERLIQTGQLSGTLDSLSKSFSIENNPNDIETFGIVPLTGIKNIQQTTDLMRNGMWIVPYGFNILEFYQIPYEKQVRNYTFPLYNKFNSDSDFGPFKMIKEGDDLKFYGKLYDLKSEYLVGEFDENQFELKENCSFSWNKDKVGIEIIDQYGNVIFCVDRMKNKQLRFNGYYKQNEFYYVFNEDKEFKTKDLGRAIDEIKKIKRIFDHVGKNSTGKRLKVHNK